MSRIKSFTIALAAVIALGGCTTTYRETLEQKMEGKSLAEKRAILAQECGSEISKGIKKDDPGNVRSFEKMRKVCEEMTRQKIEIK